MNVLVLIDKANEKNANLVYYSYVNSMTCQMLKYLRATLYITDEYLYNNDKIPEGYTYLGDKQVRFDLVVVTNCTNLEVFKRVPKKIPVIFEETDLFRPAVRMANDLLNLVLTISCTNFHLSQNTLRTYWFLPFIYDKEYEKSYNKGKSNYDLVVVGNCYWKRRPLDLIKSQVTERYKTLIIGEGWDEYKAQLGAGVTYSSPVLYKTAEDIDATCSLVDLRTTYKKYNFLTYKVVECLYQGHIPILPVLPVTLDLFGSIPWSHLLFYNNYKDYNNCISHAAQMVKEKIIKNFRDRCQEFNLPDMSHKLLSTLTHKGIV